VLGGASVQAVSIRDAGRASQCYERTLEGVRNGHGGESQHALQVAGSARLDYELEPKRR
jgi:hypothetical protein